MENHDDQTSLPFRVFLLSLLSLVTIMRAASLYAATDVKGEMVRDLLI